jgi:hypothetical protein
MPKDFVLITGHGIFPTSSILQVIPVPEVHFDLTVTAPSVNDTKFIFTVIKSVNINAEVTRANPSKKGGSEILTDYGYNRQFADSFDFAQDEFLTMVGLDEDETVKGYIKDYNRRLKKYIDYQAAVTAIESNPDLPDYATSLAAVKHNAPGSSYDRKQEKTLAKLTSYVLDHIIVIVESASDDDEDYQGKGLMDVLNSEDRLDAIEHSANEVLKEFYRKNFSPFYDDDMEEVDDESNFDGDDITDIDPSLAMEDKARDAAMRGLEIMKDPLTLTNSLDEDEDETTLANENSGSPEED